MATEAKGTLGYVFLVDFFFFIWIRSYDRETTNGDADAGTKKSGLASRFQNLKASVKTDKTCPLFSNLSIRTVCPTVFHKITRMQCAIESNTVAKFSQRNISLRTAATNSFTASRR